jgi:hypothetical protein
MNSSRSSTSGPATTQARLGTETRREPGRLLVPCRGQDEPCGIAFISNSSPGNGDCPHLSDPGKRGLSPFVDGKATQRVVEYRLGAHERRPGSQRELPSSPPDAPSSAICASRSGSKLRAVATMAPPAIQLVPEQASFLRGRKKDAFAVPVPQRLARRLRPSNNGDCPHLSDRGKRGLSPLSRR